ncbi:hypothetical protein RF11_07995 [Thelohanellus kitauei]|uniref:Integrase catalytic domain-containing protein n=1 Tax=Thelohanellus kitauei TaxID=669202 RepID=A0A0C2NMC8_THEKT|nr:hypothetical protein RF11_07995 [Thelohanellus kitauei]
MPFNISKISSTNKPENSISANIFFDTGSYRSYIRSDLAKSLNCHLDKAEKVINRHIQFQQIKDNKNSIRAKFYTIHEICNFSPDISRYRKIVERHNITDVSYTEIDHCSDRIGILIGSDLCWELIKSINRLDDKINESRASRNVPAISCFQRQRISEYDAIFDQDCLQQFDPNVLWKLDQIGIHESPIETNADISQLNFNENINRIDGRHFVSLRGKDLQRISLMTEYDNTIKLQLQNDIIEEVFPVNRNQEAHYLAHRPVIRPDHNTTKLRIVFYKNLSISDVEKAFLQIGINDDDRDFLREITDNFKVYRFKRLPFGLICAPFLLEASILYHLKQQRDKHSSLLIRNIYLDKAVIGYNSIEEAKEGYNTLKANGEAIVELNRYFDQDCKENEIVQDLGTSSFLSAFRRFISRRGFPKLIVSDNGSYFKMASKFLTKDSDLTINSCEVSKFLQKHDIVWKFIIEYAPWYGGF